LTLHWKEDANAVKGIAAPTLLPTDYNHHLFHWFLPVDTSGKQNSDKSD